MAPESLDRYMPEKTLPTAKLLTVLLSGAVLASLYFEVEVYQLGSGEAF